MFNLNCVYTPECPKIPMPTSYVLADWVHFFELLIQIDTLAPMHVLLAYAQFLCELDVDILPTTPYSSLYHDIGIEMSVDGEFPVYEAAVASGLYANGLRLLIDQASLSDNYCSTYVTVLYALVNDTAREWIPMSYHQKLQDLFGEFLPPKDIHSKAWWENYLDQQMSIDTNAPTSILGYFLEAVLGEECTVFCPLGYEPYRPVGEAMAQNSAAFDAAVEIGLFAEAIPIYFGAALDVVENWEIMDSGVEFILSNPLLSCFVPYDCRFVAEKHLCEFGTGITEEQESAWQYKNRLLHHRLRERAENLRGY